MQFTKCLVVLWAFTAGFSIRAGTDPLPSWNEGSAKQSILDFVDRVTTAESPNFVPVSERIAAFDNDGTLWPEQRLYTQFVFAIDRVKALAPQHPEWNNEEPFKSILANDIPAVLAQGELALLKIVGATHSGMTSVEFEKIVKDWMSSAKHPRLNRPYSECIYLPMLEVMKYLRSKGFKTYIVSGGGVDFMRPWTESSYGIPPEQVIGTRNKLKFELLENGPVIRRLPDLEFIDDAAGKPIAIQQIIGRKPIATFGNSDGDLQMLQWTTIGVPNSFGLIVHHTDGEREWAYDRQSKIGTLDKALDEAPSRGWVVVDMKKDWREIFLPSHN